MNRPKHVVARHLSEVVMKNLFCGVRYQLRCSTRYSALYNTAIVL